MASMSVLWNLLCVDLMDDSRVAVHDLVVDSTARSVDTSPSANVHTRAAAALLRSAPKKFQGELKEVVVHNSVSTTRQKLADEAAFELFFAANDECSRWSLKLEHAGPYDEVILGELRSTLWDFFNPHGEPLLSLAAIERYADFGPGSAPGLKGRTSFAEKLGGSVLNASSPLIIDLYHQWVGSHRTRLDCEITRALLLGGPEVMEACSITPVPKNAKISRLVKPEPLLNMFFQKGIQHLMEQRLKTFFGIDLSEQDGINAELARIGSLGGGFCTIDLSSASDYIAHKLCAWMLPRSVLNWLNLFRSKYAVAGVGGDKIELHMMATMGNAFCFPLQTIFFASVVAAVYKALGIPLRKSTNEPVYEFSRNGTGEVISISRSKAPVNFGVFGDDIVVVDEAFDSVTRVLRLLGQHPNMEKSFGPRDGCFRESCGSDWYAGVNIRGVYVKNLDTMQDFYVLINSLVSWSARTGIKLPLTVEWLLDQVKRVEVPPWENPDAGIRLPLASVKTPDVLRAAKKPDTEKWLRRPNYQGSYVYKAYCARARGNDVSSEVAAESNGYLNPSALLIAASRGVIRGGRVIERTEKSPLYRLRWRVAPSWDHVPSGDERKSFEQAWYKFANGYFDRSK